MKFFLLCTIVLSCLAVHPDVLERERIIEEINGMDTTWTAGINPKFKNSTYDHFRQLCGVLSGGPEYPSERKFEEWELNLDIPDSFDARTKWPKCPSLTEVRDQSSCGSCWAMGAVGAATDRVCIQTNQTKFDRLSARDLLACCGLCGMGCNGGYPQMAWMYFKWTGVVTGGAYNNYTLCSSYPFPKCEHHCSGKYSPCSSSLYSTPSCTRQCDQNSTYSVSWSSDKHKFKNSYSVSSIKKMQADLMTHGPAEVSFTVYSDFTAYTGGVYQHTTGKKLGGHAVKLIGWGVDNGTAYWTIANSWNEDWGENGFFRIIRGQNECGIESSYIAGDYVEM